MRTLVNDIRFGTRMLAKRPGYTGIIVLTLALAIGINTVTFSILERLLLRRLPVPKARELVKLDYRFRYQHRDRSQEGHDYACDYPLYVHCRDRTEVFSGLAAYKLGHLSRLSNPRVSDETEEVAQLAVSSNYFSVLGIKPTIGRFFLPTEEAEYGTNAVAVISHQLWHRLFDGDPAVIDKTLSVNNHILTVVGVAPPQFTGTVTAMNPAIYVTLGTEARMNEFPLDTRGNLSFHVLGRLKPGLSWPQAEAELLVAAQQSRRTEDSLVYTKITVSDGSRGTNPFSHEDNWWMFVTLLQTPTLLIMLVACANVANILLARGMLRQREIAIRRAMGACRRDIIRQLLLEGSILALLSGLGGALLAHWLTTAIRAAMPIIGQMGMPIGVDRRILLITLLGSLSSVFLFGLIPALRVSHPNVIGMLKDGTGTVTLFSRRFSLRNALVVFQVAFAVIVLSFGVLCLRSLQALRVADPGYDHKGVLAVSIHPRDDSTVKVNYQEWFTRLQERATSLPGVRAVSLTQTIPLTMAGSNHSMTGATIENVPIPDGQEGIGLRFTIVGPGYFQTLGVPLLRGRDFLAQDRSDTAKVMIVNEIMAEHFWPDQNPVGQYVTFQNGDMREVVGVVKAVKLRTIRNKPESLAFLPLAQPMVFKGRTVPDDIKPCMLIRRQGDDRSIKSFLQGELESVGLTTATYKISTLAERAGELLDLQRVVSGLLGTVGAVGLFFVTTGIAGIMAYEVSQRTQEIGIRMALGAQWRDVLRFILSKGAILTGIGLILGLGLSCIPFWFLTRYLPGFRFLDEVILYGVHLWDPATYLGVTLLISLIMIGACWIPARRAATINPMEALRYE